MKKLILIIFFAAFYIFVPFIYVNCSGQDLPYILGEEPELSESEKLEECLKLDVLISSCVDVLQEYEESLKEQESLVASVAETIDSFESCQLEESMTDSLLSVKYQEAETEEEADQDQETETVEDEIVDAEESVSDTVTCESVVADMVSAYQVCSNMTEADKFDDCYDIEQTVEEAEELCDIQDETVSADFCSSLSA